ncbi:hypothetical protein [Streptomyces sp. AM 2-1-1]|uniref:hypothetical protein n=1 Tax=Streptomyces sp. AM 2-1-1 TaxID=3028709 RepID=UPI0023B8E1C8|nr:hypothetical protein [Streptomyces sp. AM 2-1-1]WEH38340.1 hypothetical protein PZB77_01780 [Streptomyces sp. AM 2-1-1]
MNRNDHGHPFERDGRTADEHPRTASGEILLEAEEAETRVTGGERSGRDGEAADALTPNEDAQEDSEERAENDAGRSR